MGDMIIRRAGNFGFIDAGDGSIYSFSMGGRSLGSLSSASYIAGADTPNNYTSVNGVRIIPYGDDNDLPGYVCRTLERFYAGEGIMGKKVGLQWGEGPRLYKDALGDDGVTPYRHWVNDDAALAILASSDWKRQMHRCLVDMMHLEGFWVKYTRNRGSRIGRNSRLLRVEHVPATKVRYLYPGDDKSLPTHAMIADFPYPTSRKTRILPLFDPTDPVKYPESLAYYNLYSFAHDYYSVPRFVGAFEWLELAGSLAGVLAAYNENASAISLHIESPQSYWDAARERIQDYCRTTGQTYTEKMLEDFKDEAMEAFASTMTGRKNAGKFMHTTHYYNAGANEFEGWKITPVDKKIKDYIDAQVAIGRKADSAATSGFGLDPALSNLILDTKLGSGSEKLYSLKVYNASETALPDMVLSAPWNELLRSALPGTDLRVGFYRPVVDAEKNVNPQNRMKANA